MNLRDLEYLIALAEYKHFGKAAHACFVSQPTLSAQLGKLEAELGVKIFERNNKKVMISPLGGPIIAKARKILQETEELKLLAKLTHDPKAGQFRLATVPTLGPYFLPLILPQIKKSMPNLELLLYENKTENIVANLHQGELDAIILPLPIDDHGLTIEKLFSEPFVVGLPKAHPLTQKKRIQIDALTDENLLLLEEGHCMRDQVLEVCALTQVHSRIDYQATSLEMLRQMILLDTGLSLFPLLATANDKSLCFKTFSNTKNFRDIGIVWRDKNPRGNICKILIDIIKEKVPPYLAKLHDKIA